MAKHINVMIEKESIDKVLENRVLVLDGAMGTMIQRYKLKDADYRGDRFAAHPIDLKGCNKRNSPGIPGGGC